MPDESLAIGTETLILLSEFEDEVEGTVVGRRFYSSVRTFYVTAVSKMLQKFPHHDKTLSDLSFLDPNNRSKCVPQAIVRLCRRFLTDNSEDIDAVSEEFRAFLVAPNERLPSYDSAAENALDRFWSEMEKQKTITTCGLTDDVDPTSSLAYSNLARLAKVVLVLPHSNADPERLFSMVGKIETQSRSRLTPSTTCDLLTVKMNHDSACYSSQDLITDKLLQEAKSATRRCLQKDSGAVTDLV